jgi:hypothetical protein
METMANRLSREAHRQAVTAPVREVAGVLQNLLSRRLTAYIAGVEDGKTVSRWASGEVAEIRDHLTEQRLRTTYEIAQMLLGCDSAQTVKAWFIGLNPQIGDTSPAEAIRAGRLKETIAAARAFTIGG